MGCEVIYKMHGFNQCICGGQLSVRNFELQNNERYIYLDHDFLESFFINDNFEYITFVLQSGKNAKLYMQQIEDELEKICFNIIVYSEIPTSQPVCTLIEIRDEYGSKLDINDSIQIKDAVKITYKVDASVLYKKIMDINTPLTENKAIYKELFFILHNPHKAIQFIGLYDVMVNLICKPNENNKQKIMHNFFGRNRNRYSFIHFCSSNNNSKKQEDSLTHLRNEIAHSKGAGIDQFMRTCANITDREVVNILQVINDILAGEVEVDF